MTNTTDILIYGVSDDLVDVDGSIEGAAEYDACDLTGTIRFEDDELTIRVAYGASDLPRGMEWQIVVSAVRAYPEWPIMFTERPGYEGDPAVRITVPVGAVFTVVSVN